MSERAFSFGQIIPWLTLKRAKAKAGGGSGVGGGGVSYSMLWQTQKPACAQSHEKWGKNDLYLLHFFLSLVY